MDALGSWRVCDRKMATSPTPHLSVIPSFHEGSHSNALLCKTKCLVSAGVQGSSSLPVDCRSPG